MKKFLSNLAIVIFCVCFIGCVKKKQNVSFFEQMSSNYMVEARAFVKDYRTGNIELAQKACLRDWALGIIKMDIPNFEQAYMTSMVFAAERLSIICKSKEDDVGYQFWVKWRNENVGKINMTTNQLSQAVYQLDKEMGISYATKKTAE